MVKVKDSPKPLLHRVRARSQAMKKIFKNGDLPEGCTIGDCWCHAFIMTYIWWAAQRHDPWNINLQKQGPSRGVHHWWLLVLCLYYDIYLVGCTVAWSMEYEWRWSCLSIAVDFQHYLWHECHLHHYGQWCHLFYCKFFYFICGLSYLPLHI